MEDEEFQNTIATHRFSIKNFWKWNSFRVYLEFIFTLTLFSIILCDSLMKRYRYYGVNLFCIASVILESGLALPQIFLNWSQKGTTGLSLVMILGWVLGDSMKLIYFVSGNSGNENHDEINDTFIWGSVCAIILDFSVLVQMVYLYPNEDVITVRESWRRLSAQGNGSKVRCRFFFRVKRYDSIVTKDSGIDNLGFLGK